MSVVKYQVSRPLNIQMFLPLLARQPVVFWYSVNPAADIARIFAEHCRQDAVLFDQCRKEFHTHRIAIASENIIHENKR